MESDISLAHAPIKGINISLKDLATAIYDVIRLKAHNLMSVIAK